MWFALGVPRDKNISYRYQVYQASIRLTKYISGVPAPGRFLPGRSCVMESPQTSEVIFVFMFFVSTVRNSLHCHAQQMNKQCKWCSTENVLYYTGKKSLCNWYSLTHVAHDIARLVVLVLFCKVWLKYQEIPSYQVSSTVTAGGQYFDSGKKKEKTSWSLSIV